MSEEREKSSKNRRGGSARGRRGKNPPAGVNAWSATAGGALTGAVAVTAAKGAFALIATLSTPAALTLGAVGGGALGWAYVRKRREEERRKNATTPAWAAPVGTAPVDRAPEYADFAPESDSPSLPPISDALSDALSDAQAFTGSVATASTPAYDGDDFQVIGGIGPVYAARLHAAGVYTFAQLATLTPEAVQAIVSPKRPGLAQRAGDWVAMAQELDQGYA